MTEKTNTASAPTAQDIDALIDYLGQVGSMVESSIHISTARAMKARIAEMEVLKEYLSSKISHLVEALDKHNGTPCEQIHHAQEIEARDGRIAELEAALKPFADEADNWDGTSATDDTPVNVSYDDYSSSGSEFTVGDLRAARAALKDGGEQ
jgi:hypothetical protein